MFKLRWALLRSKMRSPRQRGTMSVEPTALTLGRVGRNGVRAQQRAREAQGSARDMLSMAVGALARKGWRWRKRRATTQTALASLKRRNGRSGAIARLAAGTLALGPGTDLERWWLELAPPAPSKTRLRRSSVTAALQPRLLRPQLRPLELQQGRPQPQPQRLHQPQPLQRILARSKRHSGQLGHPAQGLPVNRELRLENATW